MFIYFKMSKDSIGELENYEKLDCPYKSLSDDGKYGYTALCAISLNKLFENSDHDRFYVLTHILRAIVLNNYHVLLSNFLLT